MARVLVRFPTAKVKVDVLQGTALAATRPRYFRPSRSETDVATLDVCDAERARLAALGARIYENVQFDILPVEDGADRYGVEIGGWAGRAITADTEYSLGDVMAQIGTAAAWTHTRGKGVTIVVVDTGVAAQLREVEPARRARFDLPSVFQGAHWADKIGHGSMCAAIAAGSTAGGGRYPGVAPEAMVLAARSNLTSDDLYGIFDALLQLRRSAQLPGPLVVTNSYGLYTCSAPDILPDDHPYMSIIGKCIADGMFFCFAAGNNHHTEKCNFDPGAGGPNSIWGPNSHDQIVSVGTVSRALTNRDPATPHANSSRGPGEWARRFPKPDCVAPTYGEVPWGGSYRKMQWWGTSGACPQVAGLAALILSVLPTLAPREVADLIRETCTPLEGGPTCVGRGLINCGAAVERALTAIPTGQTS